MAPAIKLDPRERGEAAAGEALASLEVLLDTFELSNGVVLGFRDVPPFAMRRSVLGLGDRPEPPMAPGPRGGPDEPNPLAPSYQADQEDRLEAIRIAAVDVTLALATFVVSLPEGVVGPDSDVWVEELEGAGLPTRAGSGTKTVRYLEWLKLYAFRAPRDISGVTALALRRAGITEEEIAAAIATFLRFAERRADRGDAPPGPG